MQIIFVYLTFIYQIIILPQVILIVIGIVSDFSADNTNNPFSKNIFFLYSVVVSNKLKIIVSILLRSCWLKICEDRWWWCVSWLSVATKPQIDNKTELATCDYSHTSS